MSENKQGVVKSVFGPNDYGFFKIKLEGDDKWYGLGKSKPDVSKGDGVSFEFYLKDDKYPTVKGKIMKTGQAKPAASSGQSSNLSKDEWAAKDRRSARGYAVRDAVEFLSVAQAAGALTFLDKAKPAEKFDLLTAAVGTLADKFVSYVYAEAKKAEPTEAEQEQADEAME